MAASKLLHQLMVFATSTTDGEDHLHSRAEGLSKWRAVPANSNVMAVGILGRMVNISYRVVWRQKSICGEYWRMCFDCWLHPNFAVNMFKPKRTNNHHSSFVQRKIMQVQWWEESAPEYSQPDVEYRQILQTWLPVDSCWQTLKGK